MRFMDLLFKRYASPFILLDNYLENNMLHDYIVELMNIVYEENKEDIMWNIYLHKVYDKTYNKFVEECESEEISNTDFKATTIDDSKKIIENFVPE